MLLPTFYPFFWLQSSVAVPFFKNLSFLSFSTLTFAFLHAKRDIASHKTSQHTKQKEKLGVLIPKASFTKYNDCKVTQYSKAIDLVNPDT